MFRMGDTVSDIVLHALKPSRFRINFSNTLLYGHRSSLHIELTQIVGKMCIESQPIVPFRIDWMKRLECKSNHILSKLLFVHCG